MTRYPLIGILLLGTMLAIACSGNAPTAPDTAVQTADLNTESHIAWGVFDVEYDLEAGTAKIVPNRAAEAHINVTGMVTPPKCYDCVLITGAFYDVNALVYYLEVYIVNPTALTGFDVRGVISNPGGDKYLLNPDGVTSVWGAPMQFKAINVDAERSFGAYEGHGTTFNFYFPPGETFGTMTYIIDANWPGYVEEPLVENTYGEPVVGNGFGESWLTTTIWDHQGDLNPGGVMADMMQLGGSPQAPLYDDGMHHDGVAGDGIYGTDVFTTTVANGMYLINIYASDYSGHMGWGQAALYVGPTQGGENHDPQILDIVTDRTTANGAANEKVKITVEAMDPDGDALGYQYEASSGSFTGQNDNYVYWKPASSNTGPQTITITVVDTEGGFAEYQGTLWSTNKSIVSGSSQGAMPSGTLNSVIPVATLHMPDDMIGKVTYINVWGTWCGYCVQEMPELTAMYHHYESNPAYVQIHLDNGDSESQVQNFVSQYNYDCTYWAMDPGSSYFSKLKPFNGGSGGVPQHFIFDRDGNCRYSKIGAVSSTAAFEEVIDQLL